MKLDGWVKGSLTDSGVAARRLETLGYDGAFTFEGPHGPFFPLLLAAEHTERIELMTNIAVAFARSPMDLAQIANDLQLPATGASSSASAPRSGRTSRSASACRGHSP